MNVHGNCRDGVLLLRLQGDDYLDCSTAADVKVQVLDQIRKCCDVVVDLSGVQMIDSAGLGVLVSVFKAVRKHGRTVRFAGVQPEVSHVMEIIHLDRILELSPDVASAVRDLGELRN